MIRQLMNTLYVQAQGTYLRLDHETVVAEAEGTTQAQVPLHHLGALHLFGNVLVSPFLLARCAEDGRGVVWFNLHGRFQARLSGPVSGNVLLRRDQHARLSESQAAVSIARSIVRGKCRNMRHVLQRALRDGLPEGRVVEVAVERLAEAGRRCDGLGDVDALRGIEGSASAEYFQAFPLLLRGAEGFDFKERNRRPPRDPTNALLSFAYALLAQDCASALEGVGLDPQVGYLHALRPGRPALALDLMEEFRSLIADRAVLTLINRRQMGMEHFEARPGGAVTLNEQGRRLFLTHWQERKQEEVLHPALGESVPVGLLPHAQARLLARHIRGDLPEYAPFTPR